jgi:hypothetical protein
MAECHSSPSELFTLSVKSILGFVSCVSSTASEDEQDEDEFAAMSSMACEMMVPRSFSMKAVDGRIGLAIIRTCN